MDTVDSCLNPTDLDVLVARIRAHAAATEAQHLGGDGSEIPFSCRFKGIDSALRQDIDVALFYQTPFGTPAAGRFKLLKAKAKDLLRRVWSWQSRFNSSVAAATVGLSDKSTALVVEIERLERRIRDLESQVNRSASGDVSQSDDSV